MMNITPSEPRPTTDRRVVATSKSIHVETFRRTREGNRVSNHHYDAGAWMPVTRNYAMTPNRAHLLLTLAPRWMGEFSRHACQRVAHTEKVTV